MILSKIALGSKFNVASYCVSQNQPARNTSLRNTDTDDVLDVKNFTDADCDTDFYKISAINSVYLYSYP